MHELGMAQEIINIVNQTLQQHPGKTLLTVNVHIGAMNAIVPELLETAYQGLVCNSPLQQSKLVIHVIPVMVKCQACGKSFSPESFIYSCPYCESSNISVTQGDELYIKELEVD